jgi:hypothetical protein
LHVIFDCPTLTGKTFTDLDFPVLDPKNRSSSALLEKGFSSENCFVFDSFPRRVFIPKSSKKKNARELWPDLAACHDDLHKQYRKCGGKITLIMGRNAERAWRDVIENRNNVQRDLLNGTYEKLDIERLFLSGGFDVWAERSRFVSSV